MTRRLYLDDPHLMTFDATVRDVAPAGEHLAVVLDQSAFYPESGGQLPDRGTLQAHRVLDVQVHADGTVVHTVQWPDADGLRVGDGVRGVVDRHHRRSQMALHTAQHMLSQALYLELLADTVSARLSEASATIDLNIADATDAGLDKAAQAVNALIDDDVAVRAIFPTPEELAALPLRSPPKVTDNIRVIAVQDFDVTPCGGTHVERTAQIGFVHLTKTERVKKSLRVHFTAGPPGRDHLFARDHIVQQLCDKLTCGAPDLPDVLDKQLAQLKAQRQELGQLWRALADAEGRTWLTAKDPVLVVELADKDPAYLAALQGVFRTHQRPAVIVHQTAEATDVLLTSPDPAALDCGATMKALAVALGGKGGGKPDNARGRLPAPAADVARAVRQQLS